MNLKMNRALSDRLSFKSLRGTEIVKRDHLPFFTGWISILLWFDIYQKQLGAFAPDTGSLNTGDLFTYLHVVAIMLSVLFLKGNQYLDFSPYAAAVMLAGYIAYLAVPGSSILHILLLPCAIALGFIYTSALYFFAMVLNNSEKFISMAVSFIICRIISLEKENILGNTAMTAVFLKAIPVCILVSVLLCTLFYKRSYFENDEPVQRKVPGGMYLLLFLVAVVTSFSEDISMAIIKTSDLMKEASMDKIFSLGAFAGIIILILIQRVLKGSVLYIWNLSFAFLIMSFIVCIITRQETSFVVFAPLLTGSSYAMTYINMYFLMGMIVKKYRSLLFFRATIIMGAVSSLISFTVSRMIISENYIFLSNTFLIAGILVILAFFLFSPRYVNELSTAEWVDDLNRPDVTYDSRLTSRLRERKLSQKEIEVCQLLLQGYTMRQISVVLSIAYPTVNTYCTSIYRKLSINSRTELLVLLREYQPKYECQKSNLLEK